jgi:hypothetical protein
MVHFNNYILPVLFGLLNIGGSYSESTPCTISNSDSVYKTSASCTPGYYLIDKSDSSILTEAASAAVETVLLSCEGGDNKPCTETTVPGYYVNKGGNNGNFIECDSSYRCNIASVTTAACGENKVGKLLLDSDSYGICLAFNKYNDPGIKYLKVDFDKKNGSYLVKHTSGTIFSFDKTANYYALKITEDSITFNKGCTDIVDQCVLYTGGELVTRVEDFCSEDSSGRYYTCTNGKCISENQEAGNAKDDNGEGAACTISKTESFAITVSCTNYGYYLYEDGTPANSRVCLHKEGVDLTCTELSKIPVGYYWNSYQYNEVIECSGTTCKKDDLPTSCTSAEAGKIIDNGYNLEFCISNENSIPLVKDKTFEFTGIAKSIFSETTVTYVLKIDGSSLTVEKKINVSGELSKCSEKCTTDVYCINTTKIQTGSGDCADITGAALEKTAGKHYIYFDAEDKITTFTEAKKAYECEFNADGGNTLKACEVVDQKAIAISGVGELSCDKNTGCKFVAETKVTCNFDSPDENCNGYYVNESSELLSCDGKSCEKISTPLGYFVNSNTYIICNKDIIKINERDATENTIDSHTVTGDDELNYYCGEVTPTETDEETCTKGELIKISEVVKVCNTGKTSDAIAFGDDKNNYLIQANTLDGSHDETKYYILKVNSNDIQPVLDDKRHYKYIFKDSFKVLNEDNSNCSNVENSGETIDDLIEYEKNEDNTYSETTPKLSEDEASP